MATTQTEPQTTIHVFTPTPTPTEDIVARNVKRTLPVALTRPELTNIAIVAAKKRRKVRELKESLDAEKKKRNAEIDEIQQQLDQHDRDLDTEQQDRTVLCDLIFRAGMVYTRRQDTAEEIEPRPATPAEGQRFLPAVENHPTPDRNAPLLDQAAAAQAAKANGHAAPEPEDGGDADEGAGDDEDEDEDADEPEDDGLTEQTPAQKAAAESAKARKARRAAGGNGKGKAGKAKS
jgi:hypothetical protein